MKIIRRSVFALLASACAFASATGSSYFELRAVDDDLNARVFGKVPDDKSGYSILPDHSGYKWLVAPEALLTSADVSSACLTRTNPDELGRSWPVVELKFSATGSEKLLRASRARLGKHLGVLINGGLVQTAIVRAEQSAGRIEILGEVGTPQMLEGIVATLKKPCLTTNAAQQGAQPNVHAFGAAAG